MMVVHSPLTTPMELYWFVWTMSMVLCVMTGGTLWMPLLSVLSWDSQLLVSNNYLAMKIVVTLNHVTISRDNYNLFAITYRFNFSSSFWPG